MAQSSKARGSIPSQYTIGDGLNWASPWIDVELWVELPFWLMVDNATIQVQAEGHNFPIAVHDNYFNLYAGEVTESQSTVLYRGPIKKQEELSEQLKAAIRENPNVPLMWRKSKTYLKVGTRCNEDVWNAAGKDEIPTANEAKLYLVELCRAHIPVINKLIRTYRLATYDYFPYEVAPWDVPHWAVDHAGSWVLSTLVGYHDWDVKPFITTKDEPEKMAFYQLIQGQELQSQASFVPSPGELELLDALNLMERGDYSGAVRRITTAIEVIVEAVAEKAVEAAKGKAAAQKFLKDTRMRFDQRLETYQSFTKRSLPAVLKKNLSETRKLRHRIVHGGYRIGPSERGRAQKAVDVGRWAFNWFEDDKARSDAREKRVAYRSLGREMPAGIFPSKITADGIVLSPCLSALGRGETV